MDAAAIRKAVLQEVLVEIEKYGREQQELMKTLNPNNAFGRMDMGGRMDAYGAIKRKIIALDQIT